MARKWGPHRLKKIVGYVRSVCMYTHEAGLLDKPVVFGPAVKGPSKKVYGWSVLSMASGCSPSMKSALYFPQLESSSRQ
jgi:hypothetical protein